MIINLRTPSSELQINFGLLQIDTENSATGFLSSMKWRKLAIKSQKNGKYYRKYSKNFATDCNCVWVWWKDAEKNEQKQEDNWAENILL